MDELKTNAGETLDLTALSNATLGELREVISVP
ncbi:MAG: hypothetical protein ACI90Y_000118, partial [Polaromonas sp.]